MTASPAADWLPVVDGLQPDLPKGTLLHVRFKNGSSSERHGDPKRVEDWYWKQRYGGPAEIVAYRLAPLPAQPAEGECTRDCWAAGKCLDLPKCLAVKDYPLPSERAEAMINAAGQGATSDKATVASATALKGRSAEQLPVPAAPQRQNLALWLALRGRAPWPIDKRGTLPALPITSWRIWK